MLRYRCLSLCLYYCSPFHQWAEAAGNCGFDSLNRTLLSIADILQNQGTGVAASVGGTPLSGAGALIVDYFTVQSR